MTLPLGTPRNPREVELKFHLPAGSKALLETCPALAAVAAQSSRLVSTYFDTADRALDRCGLTLRIRRDGDIRTQTVKSHADGHGIAADRGEWAWPVDQDAPDLACLTKTTALAKAALGINGPLEQAFVTDVQRTTRLVHLGGDTSVEVAFDEGNITAGTAHEAISELELELKSGGVEPLYQLAATLQSLAPLWLMSDSKATRGWHLQTGQCEGSQLAQPRTLKRKVTAERGFRQLLSGALGHLTANIGPTLHGDPEGLHQSRIAIRETRALLQMFGPYLDDVPAKRFNTALRAIAQVFGRARDWDVLCLETLPAAVLDLLPDRVEDLNAVAQVERQLAHEALAQTLRGAEFSRLVLELMVWANGDVFGSSPTYQGLMRQHLSSLAPLLLQRSAARVRRRGRHVHRLTETERHNLRKSLKKLNFDLECLAFFFDAKRVKQYHTQSVALEKILGTANDAAVTGRLTLKLVPAGRADSSASAHALKRWSQLRGQRTLRDLKGAMHGFHNASPFW